MKPLNVPHKQTIVPAAFFADKIDNPEFLKSISHEMRTPLNVIIGICQFLERDKQTPLSPMHRDAVGRMDRNARALLQSINRLMESLRNGQTH
ncbi:MAG TPA: histidine kinase dimerization/phospho-acceptor domain-containing protein [Pyrinomonadaceae bacterium]|nr:histidine kinase dimerization/phospho-acceptor domain-containing protein [Pyrinomonadaceae bacterium]